MLKVKSNVPVETLKKYGFRKNGECYSSLNEECELFIWRSDTDEGYTPKGIYIDVRDYTMILTNLDLLYDLINDGLVEKV